MCVFNLSAEVDLYNKWMMWERSTPWGPHLLSNSYRKPQIKSTEQTLQELET